MASFRAQIMASFLLFTSVIASPLQANTEPRHIALRQNPVGVATVHHEGNMDVSFSNDTLDLGKFRPGDIIRNMVVNTCLDQGLCNEAEQTVGDTPFGSRTTEMVYYTAHGSYVEWIHNALIEVLASVAESQTVIKHDDCEEGSGYGAACGTYEAYCPPPCNFIETYESPSFIGISYNYNGANQDPATLSVNFRTETDKDDFGVFCSDILSVAGSLAGTIPEVGSFVGVPFSLGSVLCGIDS